MKATGVKAEVPTQCSLATFSLKQCNNYSHLPTSMARINHIHGSYQPHPRRLHWSRQPSMLHKEQK